MGIFDNILTLPAETLCNWGYIILLAATLCETIPFFGVLIPGQTLVIAGGVLVKMGILSPVLLILTISLGAILGDSFGYFIGKKYGHDFIMKYGKYFLLKKENFEKVKKLIDEHVGKALILGRLNSFTRATIPLVTGTSEISFKKFLTYNILGGFIWATTFTALGFLFGASVEIALRYVGKWLLIAIISTIIIVAVYKFINKRKHIFEKYHIYALSLCIISLWIFSEMVDTLSVQNTTIPKIDTWLNAQIATLWTPLLNNMMIFITNFGGSINIIILSIGLFTFLLITKKWHNSLLLLLSMIGGFLGEQTIKEIIARPRPANSLIEISGSSFPSGHATMSIIFFSLLIYSFKNDIKSGLWRNLFVLGNITLFVLIGFSRIYLNVHWLSDVIAGFSLGLFWLTLLIIIFKITIFLVNSYKTYLNNQNE
jgi:undecaprenyl-diphosphatase